MKILVIGSLEHEDSFATNIVENFIKLSHETHAYDTFSLRIKINNKFGFRLNQILTNLQQIFSKFKIFSNNKKLFKLLKKINFDLVLVTHDYLKPNDVYKIKNEFNPIIAMWFPDHLANFGKAYFMNAPYDFLFFKDPYIISLLENRISSKVYYLPECYNEFKHKYEGEIADKYKCEITTAGNFHSWRVALFEHLSEYNIKFWGMPPPLWMPKKFLTGSYQNHAVYNEEKAKAFLGAKIVLNNLHFAEIYGLNARAFEAAGIGSFQLLDWRPGIENLFTDGVEIITFNGIKDLKIKLNYWLEHPIERELIAKASKKRAMHEHTYLHRLQLIIDTIQGKKNGFPLPKIE